MDNWTELAALNEEWTAKREKIIDALDETYGEGFAQKYGDFIRLTKDGRVLSISAVSPTEYRIGNHLDLGNFTGTPVGCHKLIYHIGSFANGEG